MEAKLTRLPSPTGLAKYLGFGSLEPYISREPLISSKLSRVGSLNKGVPMNGPPPEQQDQKGSLSLTIHGEGSMHVNRVL